ncbi:MAG: GTPase Era, partial [Bacteroidetes bacterium]|nr:GTPase Era [Bacteroidota bacterium]
VDALDPKMDKDIEHDVAFQALNKINKSAFLLINKVDIIDKFKLLPIIDFYSKRFEFVEVFPISALNALGTADLLKSVVEKLPVHPPYYPLDFVSDSSERFFVSELIREKIFEKFRQEIPYSTTVEIIEFREQVGKKDFISAEIYVERQSQKGILIGKNGLALKQIGELARVEIEKFLGRSVFLELHIKVREKWRDSDTWLKRLGYRSRK